MKSKSRYIMNRLTLNYFLLDDEPGMQKQMNFMLELHMNWCVRNDTLYIKNDKPFLRDMEASEPK